MKFRPTLKPIRRSLHDATVVNPADYIGVVGQHFVKRERSAVLVIGTQTWDRWTLGRLGVPHPRAAAMLNRVVQQLNITSLPALAQQARAIGDYQGIGVTAYWTICAILREAGYDVLEVHADTVTFDTLKQRAKARAAKERVRQRKRTPPPPPPEGEPT